MAGGNFAELLKALTSSQNQERQQAETLYQQAKASEPDNLVIGLVAVLSNDSADEVLRRQGAVLLRQLVTPGSDKDFVFARITLQHKQDVATELLRRFEVETDPKLQRKVGEVVSKLAEVTLDTEDKRGWLTPEQGGWPLLMPQIFRMANAGTNTSATSCEASIRLLKDLVPNLQEDVITTNQELVSSILQSGLMHADLKVRCATLLLVCELVESLDKKSWAPLVSTAGTMLQVLQQLAQANLQEELQECIEAYIEVATLEPNFFKQQISTNLEPATFFLTLVKTRDGADEGLRSLALEWLVTYIEKKPKWLAKIVPTYAPLALESCMELMLEIEDGEDELKCWAERMDDEEGEEDFDALFHSGESAIDRIAEAMGIENVITPLSTFIARYVAQDIWQAKHAAVAAIRQVAEYVEDFTHTAEMGRMLLEHVDHAHPRVRFTALNAIQEMSGEQAPKFQETSHQTVMPTLLRKMDDPVDRVTEMAMSAFVSFGTELDNALMMGHAHSFMQKLVEKLRTTSHRGIREESITSIAVIAGVIEGDFSQYYDGIMPLLKQLVMTATGEKENRLRGKAFECMSLLGLAVGKDKFLPDAREALAEMMKLPIEADDLQREYIKEASERICKCLKADFAPFLSALLPGIYRGLSIQGEDFAPKPQNAAQSKASGDDDDDEDDEYITVSTGEGKIVKVKNARLEELLQSAQLLHTFCSEMEGAFFDYVPQTAEAILPLLSTSDELALLCDEARSSAFQAWAALIKCARLGSIERGGQQSELPRTLLTTFLQRVIAAMQKDDDPSTLQDAADGVAECLKNAGPGVFGGEDLLQLVRQLFVFIDESFERTRLEESKKQSESVSAPAELQHDEDDADVLDDEEECRRSLAQALGAAMQSDPASFMPCLPECASRMTQWLPNKQNKVIALYLACDVIRHLKEQSESVWPVFMSTVFESLADEDPDVRIAASYAINLAAPLASFAEAAPEAFKRLAHILSVSAPKNRDAKAKSAADNAVSALLTLAKEKPTLCPSNVPVWQIITGALPIKEDEEEAKKCHKTIVDLLVAQHAPLLGPDNAYLGKVLSALAEVHLQEDLCTKETDGLIARVFKMIPADNLSKLAGDFSEKQQKKIEKLLASESVRVGGC